MSSPKEKAKELVDKYRTYAVMWTGGIKVENENVKQCALIAVDEILAINMIYNISYDPHLSVGEFYENVKEEINNL